MAGFELRILLRGVRCSSPGIYSTALTLSRKREVSSTYIGESNEDEQMVSHVKELREMVIVVIEFCIDSCSEHVLAKMTSEKGELCICTATTLFRILPLFNWNEGYILIDRKPGDAM
jgi:hypothetical protein